MTGSSPNGRAQRTVHPINRIDHFMSSLLAGVPLSGGLFLCHKEGMAHLLGNDRSIAFAENGN